MDDLSKAHALARRVRAFLEAYWRDWQREDAELPPSSGRCFGGSALLQGVLADAGIESIVTVGAVTVGGRNCPHFWVTCQGHILDITGDQFGGLDPVELIAPGEAHPYAFQNHIPSPKGHDLNPVHWPDLLEVWRTRERQAASSDREKDGKGA